MLKFIYKPPHGFFKGYADKKISPCVNASAWQDNTFTVMIADEEIYRALQHSVLRPP